MTVSQRAAKMADFARKLPKWQAPANAVPNDATANIMPKEIFFAWIFFI